MTTLSIQRLRKRYLTKEALRGVTFSVEPDRVVGILGPNGSGKTTLLKLIAGLLTPTDGEVIVDGGTGRGGSMRMSPTCLTPRRSTPGRAWQDPPSSTGASSQISIPGRSRT